MPTQRAWLHRNGRTTWLFEFSAINGELTHVTRSGTVYVILPGLQYGKPFWVARVSQDSNGKSVCVTCEAELRARSIEFEDAGEYFFDSGCRAVSDRERDRRQSLA